MALSKHVLGQFKNQLGKAGCAAAVALAFIAAPAAANCLTMGAADNTISTDCAASARDSTKVGNQQGVAAFNAARAHIRAARASAVPTASFVEAVTWTRESEVKLPDADLVKPDYGKNNFKQLGYSSWRTIKNTWPKLRDGFRYDRMMTLVDAYEGLAKSTPFASNAVCVSTDDCRTKALSVMSGAGEDLVKVFTPTTAADGDARFNAFYFRRAQLLEDRNGPADASSAISDYLKVMESKRNEHKVEATDKFEALTLRLGGENLALTNGTAWDRAIDFYTTALKAGKRTGLAYSGIGQAHLKYCESQVLAGQDRIARCLRAADAFESAAKSVGGDPGVYQTGAGKAYAIAATQMGRERPNDPAIAEYNRRSAAAYAASGTSAGLLERARVQKSIAPDEALKAYREYVALETGYADWFAESWQTSVGPQFAQKVAGLNSTARGNIGDAILEMYQTRISRSPVRKDVGISLLGAALLAKTELPDAALELGKLHMEAPANLNDAKWAFDRVVASTSGPSGALTPERQKMRAEGLYQLSRIEAEKSGSPTAAKTTKDGLDKAREALSLNSVDPRFRKAACIAYMVRYTYTVADQGNVGFCSGIGGAEGQLLLGFFSLRAAQESPTEAKRKAWFDSARAAFENGRTLVAPTPVGGTPEKFDSQWPKTPSPLPIDLLLRYGRAWASSCAGAGSVELEGVSGTERELAKAQLNFYGINRCR